MMTPDSVEWLQKNELPAIIDELVTDIDQSRPNDVLVWLKTWVDAKLTSRSLVGAPAGESAKCKADLPDAVACVNSGHRSAATKILKECQDRWVTASALFRMADTDGNGILSLEEFQLFFDATFKSWEVEEKHHDALLRELFDELDTLHGVKNGAITEEQFLFFLSQAPEQVEVRVPRDVPGAKNPNAKLVALVAHNNMKPMLIRFVEENQHFFRQLRIVTTGTTGQSLEKRLGLVIAAKVASGPLGGDQEIGGMVCNNLVGAMFFFKDPLSIQGHNADIEALVRLCDVYQTPYATNASTARALLHSIEIFGLDGIRKPITERSAINAYKAAQKSVLSNITNPKN